MHDPIEVSVLVDKVCRPWMEVAGLMLHSQQHKLADIDDSGSLTLTLQMHVLIS